MRQQRELGITSEDVLDVVDAMCQLSQWHEIYYLWRTPLPDEKDEMLLELAIKAGSAHIVTYNTRDSKGAAEFGVEIVTPKSLLERIGVIK